MAPPSSAASGAGSGAGAGGARQRDTASSLNPPPPPPQSDWSSDRSGSERRLHGHSGSDEFDSPSPSLLGAPSASSSASSSSSGPRRRSSSGCSSSPSPPLPLPSHHLHHHAVGMGGMSVPASPHGGNGHASAMSAGTGASGASGLWWTGGVRASVGRVARLAALQLRRSMRSMRAPPSSALSSAASSSAASASAQFAWLRAADGVVVPASRSKLRRAHGARFHAPLVRLADALWTMPAPRWAVAIGAAAFLLLCFLPAWLPPASSATMSSSASSSSLRNGGADVAGGGGGGGGGQTDTGPTGDWRAVAALQRPWDPSAAEADAGTGGGAGRPSTAEMDRTLRLSRARLRLSPGALAAEALTRDLAPGTHDPAHAREAAKYLARHAPRPAMGVFEWLLRPFSLAAPPPPFQLSRSSVDTITLAYQKAGAMRVTPSLLAPAALARPAGRSESRRAQQQQQQLQLQPGSSQLHPLDAALAAANPSFAQALAQQQQSPDTAAAAAATPPSDAVSARFRWEWNRHRWVEYQFTQRAWIDVEETRRLKLVRDYAAFPSPLPSFLSLPPLARFDSTPPPSYADIPVAPPERLYAPERTLLFYVFAYNHDEYMQNMETFIARAVRAHQPVDYVFFINQMEGRDVEMGRLPPLPPNARYVAHKNECMDWGTIGWFMQLQRELARDEAAVGAATGGGGGSGSALRSLNRTLSKYHVDIHAYKYFLIMNSSVRGPWFPSYIDLDDPRNAWWTPLAQVLRRDTAVRMVGPLINCQISPHVQSYVLLLDQQAFALLRGVDADEPLPEVTRQSWWSSFSPSSSLSLPFSSLWSGGSGAQAQTGHSSSPSSLSAATDRPLSPVFTCHSSWTAAVHEAEVGSSIQLLRSGFNIASISRAFAHMDFRTNLAQECLGMEWNPSQDVLAGPLVTSGPDAAHVAAQIEMLLAHHDRLLAAQHAREDEHDLEGDVLSQAELAARADTLRRRAEDLEGDDESDWDWTPRSASAEALDAALQSAPDSPSNEWIRHRRLDGDLDTQLRVIAAAKRVVIEASIRKVAGEYAKQQRDATEAAAAAKAAKAGQSGAVAVPSGSDAAADLSALVVPLLPSSMRLHRARPEVLLRRGETYDAAVDGLGAAIAPPAAKDADGSAASSAAGAAAAGGPGTDPSTLIDLDFLRRLTAEIRAYPYRSVEAPSGVESGLRSTPGSEDRPHAPPLPAHLRSDAPLPPALHRERARLAQHAIDMETIYINPLEVVFGKWKYKLSMVDSSAYDRYATAARDRRAHNHARRVRRAADQWARRSRGRWAQRWDELPTLEAEEMRRREEEQRARLELAQQKEAAAAAAAPQPSFRPAADQAAAPPLDATPAV